MTRPAAAFAAVLLMTAACAGNPVRTGAPSSGGAAVPPPKAASVPAAVSAAPPAAAAAAAPPAVVVVPKGAVKKVWGHVASVDAAAGTISILDRSGKTRAFRVAAGADLTRGGSESATALSDVAAGDRVRIGFVGDVAASVHVYVPSSSVAGGAR